MTTIRWSVGAIVAAAGLLPAIPAMAQSFRVQCPQSTITHPTVANNNSEPAYTAPTYLPVASGAADYTTGKAGPDNGAIKCQQISGGDGYATMGDGTQTYMFSFGPLSGLSDIAHGLPGTQFPSVFNTTFASPTSAADPVPGDPATTDIGTAAPNSSGVNLGAFNWNGAVGLASDIHSNFTIYDISDKVTGRSSPFTHTVTVVLNQPSPFKVGDSVVISQGPVGTDLNGYGPLSAAVHSAQESVTNINAAGAAVTATGFPANYGFQYTFTSARAAALAEVTTSPDATASSAPALDGHVDPRQVMDVGVMNGNIPAPLIAIDEDDELFLTLSNVGMIMRPDLFEQHTVHFHGYPNASAFYDGVPDASVAISIGASFTYYYLAPDAGTYFWHCHITPPEHLQMGMVGQLYVRPRQNRWNGDLYKGLQTQAEDLRTGCNSRTDLLCSNPLPKVNTGATNDGTKHYAYNDGDGSTYYDLEVPLQMHGFDPNFHFVGMTFNPEGFADMKDKYFLLNGRSYPDTVNPNPISTQSSDSVQHFSQPLSALIRIPVGKRALVRISELNVSEYHTLASLGIPMQVIGYNAKLLRDQAGNNLYYTTNSITLGGGESLDIILDTCLVRSTPADPSSSCTTSIPAGTYYLYTSNLDHLSNDAENFGGMMTEVVVSN